MICPFRLSIGTPFLFVLFCFALLLKHKGVNRVISDWKTNNRCIESSSVNKHQILVFLICAVTLYLYGYGNTDRETDRDRNREREETGRQKMRKK